MTASQKLGKRLMESQKRRYSRHYLDGQINILLRSDCDEKSPFSCHGQQSVPANCSQVQENQYRSQNLSRRHSAIKTCSIDGKLCDIPDVPCEKCLWRKLSGYFLSKN